jgi:carbon monoxide dehydrogenase subunit G
MKIESSFTVPLKPEAAWPLLLDVPRMARSMPGAELTEIVDKLTYKGKVVVKLGPVRLTFSGEAKIEDLDDVGRRARVAAKGNDTGGRGYAQAKVDFAMVPEGSESRVNVVTDLQLAGAVAQYGRGAGLINAVASQLVGEFAENLRKDIGASQPAAPEPAAATATLPPADVAVPAPPPPPSSAPPAAAPAKELSGFGILGRALWSIVVGWFRRLTGARQS